MDDKRIVWIWIGLFRSDNGVSGLQCFVRVTIWLAQVVSTSVCKSPLSKALGNHLLLCISGKK